MENDALKQVQDRLAELPADVRSAIQSADLDGHVQAIGTKNNLHIDQIGELGDEVMLAMLGFSPLETLDKRLVQVLGVTPEAAQKLAADIGTDIFAPIRESMRKFSEGKVNTTPTPSPTTFAAPATPRLPVSPDLQKVDVMLSQKTLSPAPAPANPIYKADPYREPI